MINTSSTGKQYTVIPPQAGVAIRTRVLGSLGQDLASTPILAIVTLANLSVMVTMRPERND